VTQFTISCAVELLRSVTSDDIMTALLKKNQKVINIDQNSRSQTAAESVWSVSKLSTESVGSRRELVANSVDLSHRRRRCDSARQLSRVVVGGVYWAHSVQWTSVEVRTILYSTVALVLPICIIASTVV